MLVSTPALDPSSTDPETADAARPLPVSLDAFLAEIGPRAFRFAEAGLRQREDALDAVQDAMIKLLAYRERPAQEWTPLFWSILRRRIIDLQRRRGFRLRFWAPASERGEDSQPDWADEGPSPAQHHEQRQTHARLVAALRALPARQREAFTLRVLEELDVATTARAMGCSEGSVKTHLSRAREALQKHLEDVR
ncbi:RNA polymerase sigma factor [Xanthomonas sp. AM6]|uniref:RNA polymerase sigma factor n=1 Tax=Xanthomonas sp. AM6 TaxID=2982531 RepID=UPI0021D8BAD0|nr:RNA polymerase sigma factor [Xanthomonas sp. AM6]UYB51511.1 RNA polymerase sigma factor [Xanthomonas sp. AM6]